MVKPAMVLLLVFFSLNVVLGQVLPSIVYTGKEEQIPLTEFLQKIEKSYSIHFFYKPEWFNSYKVDIEATNLPINEVLARIMADKPYEYRIIQGNNIVFLPKEKLAMLMGQMVDKSGDLRDISTTIVGNPNEAGKYKQVQVSGTVVDGKNDETLVGSVIQVENTSIATASDNKGHFSFTISPGIYNVLVSNVGYEQAVYKVRIVSNGNLSISLFEKTLRINEVIISAQRADRNVRSSQMSIVEMDARTIKQLPSLVGEKDVLKSFTMMPGVKSVGEFGSGINVRGGGEDQNLYLIEGAPVFNTSHVFGLISVLNPDAVSNVTLYKGHIPSGFGERVSSVMDIQMRDNIASKDLHARGGIGLFDSRLMFDGPIIKDKLTFKLGGRTSYSDWLLKNIQDYYLQHSSASFYDLNGLLNWNYNKNRITLFAYNSYDHFRYANELAYTYGSSLGSLTWNRFWTSNLNSTLSLAYSQYTVNKDDIIDTTQRSRLKLRTIYMSTKYNMKYTGIEHHTIESGFQLISYQSFPGKKIPLDTLSSTKHANINKQNAYETAIYIGDNFEINDKLTLNAGLRYSAYFLMGPFKKMLYKADDARVTTSIIDSVMYSKGKVVQTYQGIEPRLSLKYQLTESASFKVSYNRNRQYISLLSNTSISTPNDLWKLTDAYIKPIIADQYAIGYYQNFVGNTLETSVELYYKNLQNLQEYKNDAETVMSSHVETELDQAKAKNYGIELLIKKNSGKIDGWISYTYSRALRHTTGIFRDDQINRNREYPSAYDKPHDLTIVANYHINKRVRFSGNFMFSSGRPVTLPEYRYSVGGNSIVYYSDRNAYRLSYYHRLDLSLSVDESLRIKKKWKGSWTFSILNVYGKVNPYSVFYKKSTASYSNNFSPFSDYELYMIGKPLPVITYNFIF
jgi:hypothetical protein